MVFRSLSQRQRLAAAIAFIAIVAVLIVFLVNRAGSAGGGQDDARLARTAARVLPLLNHPSRLLPVDDTSLHSFQAWFYDLRAPFQTASKLVPSEQFIEVVVQDPNTFPPQAPSLSMPGHSPVYADAASGQKVTQSGQPVFTTVNAGGHSYRVYLHALKPPAILGSAGMSGMLLVIKPT